MQIELHVKLVKVQFIVCVTTYILFVDRTRFTSCTDVSSAHVIPEVLSLPQRTSSRAGITLTENRRGKE